MIANLIAVAVRQPCPRLAISLYPAAAGRRTAGLIAALALVGAAPANAAIMKGVVTGSFSSATVGFYDPETGTFVFDDLANARPLPFRLTTRFDTERGERESLPGVLESIIGGSSLEGNVPSPGSALLEVEGRTLTFSGERYSEYARADFGPFLGKRIVQFVSNFRSPDDPSQGLNSIGFSLFGADSLALDSPFTGTGEFWIQAAFPEVVFRVFEIDGVRIEISAVPEPATWAMMIAGFGLAGAGLRARRVRLSFV